MKCGKLSLGFSHLAVYLDQRSYQDALKIKLHMTKFWIMALSLLGMEIVPS